MVRFELFIAAIIGVYLNVGVIESATDWWQNGNFYQIYPRSFMDSNNDGVGDLNGITSKLEYVKSLGMSGLWLSPIFQSPMADFGYDISDYTKIHSEYGTLDDFTKLKDKCHELGIKLILDFVPNHTSDEHEWFTKSAARDPEYENYYIWDDGITVDGQRAPPNNWISIFRFSAWKWHEGRQQYYLHQFLDKQPDLNYREPKVVVAMKNVLRLWLQRGVDGFRIDAVPFLYEIEKDSTGKYLDEPRTNDPACGPDDTCYLNHIYTQNLDPTFDMVYQWRAVMDEFKTENGGDTKILMTEAYTSLENNMRLYTNGVKKGSQIPFNFELISNLKDTSTATDYAKYINLWLNTMPKAEDFQANWVVKWILICKLIKMLMFLNF